MMKSGKPSLLLMIACVLLLAACGGEEPTSTPEPAAVEAPPATPTPVAEATATETAPATIIVTDTEEMLDTGAMTSTEPVTGTDAVTSTEPATTTAPGTSIEAITTTDALTSTVLTTTTTPVTSTETTTATTDATGEPGRVTIENVSFVANPTLASGWTGSLIEDNSDMNVPPDLTIGPRRVLIEGEGDDLRKPYLFVFNLADLAGKPEQAETDALAELLATGADPATTPTLPYLPRINASQAVHGAEQLLDFASGQGIRYVTAFAQDPSPFLGHSFIYTFQGLTGDGQYYVAFSAPLTTELFPAELPTDFDFAAHEANYTTYLTTTQETIRGAAPDAFMPNLSTLDALVQSITIDEAAAAPGASPGEVDLSSAPPAELADVTWQLVKIIAVDGSEVVPDDPAKYTLTFGSGQRVAVRADCNQGGGPYDANDGKLTIGMLISTRAACPDDSLYNEYMKNLETVASYEIADGMLTISLADDGGVMQFAPAQ
jgi:heat shock protein HslJ